MKPNLSPIFLIGSLFITSFAPLIAIHPAIAQTNPSPLEELFYTFKGEKIRLRQRQKEKSPYGCLRLWLFTVNPTCKILQII